MPFSLSKMIDIPPVWLFGFAVGVWILDRIFPVQTGLGVLRDSGTVLVTAACALLLLAAWQFRVHKTTIIPHQTARSLITSGVFSRSRNPIYLADAMILTGLALRWDFWPGLLLVPPFIWVIQARFIQAEEARLQDAFPTEFAEYASRTRRWL